jgi:hypothetical protein
LVAQPGGEDAVASLRRTLDELPRQPPTLRILNKSDLAADPTDDHWDFQTVATESHGVAELLHEIVARLTASVPPPGSPVPICKRQVDWLLELAAAADDADWMRSRLTAL